MNIIRTISLFGEEYTPVNHVNISSTQNFSTRTDVRVIIDETDNITLTLDYEGNEEGVKAEILTYRPCTIRYYSDSATTVDFAMAANTSVYFVYHNGWKHNGIYDAVWN